MDGIVSAYIDRNNLGFGNEQFQRDAAREIDLNRMQPVQSSWLYSYQ
jgi:hypothetical protein